MNLAFIGLGNMGSPMAFNLLREGHQLTVYNRSHSKANLLVAEGARLAESPASAVQNCDAVLTMLSNDAALEEIAWGSEGFGPALASGIPHVSHSTITVGCARRLAKRHRSSGHSYIAAPVFGRPEAAQNRKLVVIAAGESSTIERFQPLFDAIGRRTFVAGSEPWQANAIKLCGNLMILSLIETFGEALAGIRKSKIDPHIFHNVISEVFSSPVYQNYGATIVEERFDPPGFALKHGFKDIRCILDLAQDREVPMPLASLIHDHLLSSLAHGEGEMDTAVLARVSARDANL